MSAEAAVLPVDASERNRRANLVAFGVMVALRGTEIIRVPLVEATSQLKLVPPQRYAEAEVFFG